MSTHTQTGERDDSRPRLCPDCHYPARTCHCDSADRDYDKSIDDALTFETDTKVQNTKEER